MTERQNLILNNENSSANFLVGQSLGRRLSGSDIGMLNTIHKIANQKGYKFKVSGGSSKGLWNVYFKNTLTGVRQGSWTVQKICIETMLNHARGLKPCNSITREEVNKRECRDARKLRQIKEQIEGLKEIEQGLEERLHTKITTELSN